MHSIRVFSLSPFLGDLLFLMGLSDKTVGGERMSGQLNGSLCFWGGGYVGKTGMGLSFLGMYVYV